MEQIQYNGERGGYRDALDRLRVAKNWLWWLLLLGLLIELALPLTVQFTSLLDDTEGFRAASTVEADAPQAPASVAPFPPIRVDSPDPKQSDAPAPKPTTMPTDPPTTQAALTLAQTPTKPTESKPEANQARPEPAPAQPEPKAEPADEKADPVEKAIETGEKTLGQLIYTAMKPGLALIRAGGLFLACMLMLVLLLSAKMVLLGRLNGIAFIISSVLWSVVLAVLMAPWDLAFPGFPIPGILYGRADLVAATGQLTGGWETQLLYWARFVGYPLLGIILLMTIQTQYARARRRVLQDSTEQ